MNRRLLLLLIPVVVAGCSRAPGGGNPCAGSAPPFSSNRPVVCVDDSNLASITSEPQEARGKRRAPIKWYTKSGQGGMTIAFQDAGCVKTSIDCSSGSRCDGQMVDSGATGARCKYTVTLLRNGTTNKEDPVVILDDGIYEEKQ